jgi:hypothetical protein
MTLPADGSARKQHPKEMTLQTIHREPPGYQEKMTDSPRGDSSKNQEAREFHGRRPTLFGVIGRVNGENAP